MSTDHQGKDPTLPTQGRDPTSTPTVTPPCPTLPHPHPTIDPSTLPPAHDPVPVLPTNTTIHPLIILKDQVVQEDLVPIHIPPITTCPVVRDQEVPEVPALDRTSITRTCIIPCIPRSIIRGCHRIHPSITIITHPTAILRN
jgi:hypothetical protein